MLKSPHVNKKAREQFELKIYNTIVNFDKSFINNVFITHLIKNKPKNIKLKILMFSKEDNLMVKY